MPRSPLLAILVASLTVIAGLQASIRAEATELSGIWMHVGDRYGMVIGHLEVLTISASGEVTAKVIVSRDYEPGCETAEQQALPQCAPRRVTERGTLLVEPVSRTLRIADIEEVTPAFDHSFQQEGWGIIRSAVDEPWSYRLQGDRLVMTRPARSYDGFDFVLIKVFHRVDEAEPEETFLMLRAMEASLVRASCALDAIHTDAELRPAFRALVAAIGGLARQARLTGLKEGDLAAFAGQVAGAEPSHIDAYLALRAWWNDNEASRSVLFPDAMRVLPEIESCIEILDW
jgi:hypothetical protein